MPLIHSKGGVKENFKEEWKSCYFAPALAAASVYYLSSSPHFLYCSKHAEVIQFSSPVWSACQEGVILPSPSPALFWTQI